MPHAPAWRENEGLQPDTNSLADLNRADLNRLEGPNQVVGLIRAANLNRPRNIGARKTLPLCLQPVAGRACGRGIARLARRLCVVRGAGRRELRGGFRRRGARRGAAFATSGTCGRVA